MRSASKLAREWIGGVMIVLMWLAPWFSGARGGEAVAKAATAPPPTITAVMKHEEGQDIFPTDRAWVTIGTNKCAFVVPKGLRMSVLDGERLSLATSDFSCQVTVRPHEDLPAGGDELTAACRALVSNQYPGAEIKGEYGMSADNQNGPAFDLEWQPAKEVARRVRAGFVPYRGGVLEFELSCSPAEFEKGKQKLEYILMTFRAGDAKGKLEVPRMSNKI